MPSLDPEDLRARLLREIQDARHAGRHRIRVKDRHVTAFPLTLDVTLVDAPGPQLEERKVRHRFFHDVEVTITDEYPYVKPIVQWRSPVFHPNIMTPAEGGYVCTRLIDDWAFDRTLSDYLEGLVRLVRSPDPEHAHPTPTSKTAADYFRKVAYRPPRSALERATV